VGDAGLPERGDALLHVTRRAAQRREFQELVGYRRLGLLLFATEVEVLDDGGLLLEA